MSRGGRRCGRPPLGRPRAVPAARVLAGAPPAPRAAQRRGAISVASRAGGRRRHGAAFARLGAPETSLALSVLDGAANARGREFRDTGACSGYGSVCRSAVESVGCVLRVNWEAQISRYTVKWPAVLRIFFALLRSGCFSTALRSPADALLPGDKNFLSLECSAGTRLRAAAPRANSICFGGGCSQATPKTSA